MNEETRQALKQIAHALEMKQREAAHAAGDAVDAHDSPRARECSLVAAAYEDAAQVVHKMLADALPDWLDLALGDDREAHHGGW
jgi:hypothetical protein